jgi:transcriptional regulator with XRE-family HTH domain
MTRLRDLKKRLMEDPGFRDEYARADDEFKLIEELVRARAAAKLTQTELAERLGTTQSAVARLEGGGVSPSFTTLRRYAEATGTRLTVAFVPARRFSVLPWVFPSQDSARPGTSWPEDEVGGAAGVAS